MEASIKTDNLEVAVLLQGAVLELLAEAAAGLVVVVHKYLH
jgi:hypothetical protein